MAHDTPSSASPSFTAPSTLLIIGSGVFGLSTAYALTRRPEWQSTQITVLDRAGGSAPSFPENPVFPSRDASSIDSSRIIRADYADSAYAALASAAQYAWRQPGPDSIGGEGRYTETGFVLVADDEPPRVRNARGLEVKSGMGFARDAYANALAHARQAGRGDDGDWVQLLDNRAAIAKATTTGAELGDWGYLNRGSGWANAERAMAWLYERVEGTGRVKFVSGTVDKLEIDAGQRKVVGAKLKNGQSMRAELVVVAAGAWTPSLVDLRGQAVATGQVLGYMDITPEEQARLGQAPVLMNLTSGTFLIPPSNNVLKVGLHGYGYQNPKKVTSCLTVPKPTSISAFNDQEQFFPEISVSQPLTHLDDPTLWMPASGERALRKGLRAMVPWPSVADRPFTANRVCWYTDTPTGDFLVAYHPYWSGLFLATGGSGHGFKFLPVLGEHIADSIMGKCTPILKDKWAWKEVTDVERSIVTEDGSRGGQAGLILQTELRKNGPRI
ncbi:FAD dependent oxidoreductase-domain-containing protein [Apiospora hydei]|uniref:FAD dependent oxidoreductase-domain-containing protein n=1 Tax=Apiospora hydei TaxID=1337664 RepID=A0ABR1V6T1_9PEZI